jgi:hypothetical protein
VITAVDTNVLFDILVPDAPAHYESRQAIIASQLAGAVVVGEAVYAELAAEFSSNAEIETFLRRVQVELLPSSTGALFEAGEAWRNYTDRRPRSLVCPACGNQQLVHCERCGANLRPRQHVVADFLIGGHALADADRLLTRDRGFYATYFPELRLV